MLYYNILYYIILHYTILHYTTLHCTTLYYTILYYTIPYYNICCDITKYFPARSRDARVSERGSEAHKLTGP